MNAMQNNFQAIYQKVERAQQCLTIVGRGGVAFSAMLLYLFSITSYAAPGKLSDVPLGGQFNPMPANVMFVLDSSGSMDTTVSGTGKSRSRLMEEAMVQVIDDLANDVDRAETFVGVATYNRLGNAGRTGGAIHSHLVPVGANQAALTAIVSNVPDNGSTPIAETQYDLGNYFTRGTGGEQLILHPGTGVPNWEYKQQTNSLFTHTPEYLNSLSQPNRPIGRNTDTGWCQQNFIVFLTDGEPYRDNSISNHLRDYDGDCNNTFGLSHISSGCITVTNSNAGDAAPHPTPNGNNRADWKNLPGHTYTNNVDASDYFDDMNFALRDIDLRPDLCDPLLLKEVRDHYSDASTTCRDLVPTGSLFHNATNTVTGNLHREVCDFVTLDQLRKKGFSNLSIPANPSATCRDLPAEADKTGNSQRFVNNILTYVIGFGTAVPAFAGYLDEAARMGGTGVALDAGDKDTLVEAMSSIFDSISQKLATSSTSLTFDSGTTSSATGALVSAGFDTNKWSGTVNRRDTTDVGRIVWDIARDGDTNLETQDYTNLSDSDGDGNLDDGRRVFTFDRDNKVPASGVHFAVSDYNDLPDIAQDDLEAEANSSFAVRAASTSYQQGDVVIPPAANGYIYRAENTGTTASWNPSWSGSSVNDGGVIWERLGTVAETRLHYLRGDHSASLGQGGYRNRDLALGDIINSNPLFVPDEALYYWDDLPAAKQSAYINFSNGLSSSESMVYVGANDGMVHGIIGEESNGGDEAFAYIPSFLFSDQEKSGLHYLTQTDYGHKAYVDGSVTVADAQIRPGNGADSWSRVLVGTGGRGGKGVYALDVTAAESTSESDVLWEFTHEDDDRLGYVTTQPAIVLMENNRWAAIVPNGYDDDDPSDTSRRKAGLFILYLDANASDGWTKDTEYFFIEADNGGTGKNGLSGINVVDTLVPNSPAVVPKAGRKSNFAADRVYAGDLEGKLWVFDLSDTSDSDWELGLDRKPLFTAQNDQPITSTPVAVRALNPPVAKPAENCPNLPCPNALVFFGTGQYLTLDDVTNIPGGYSQSYYGVFDDGSTSELTASDLQEQTYTTATTSSGDLVRVTTGAITDWWTLPSKSGWYFDLPDTGERQVGNSLYVDFSQGGSVLAADLNDPSRPPEFVAALTFTTIIPDDSDCGSGGTGWVMFVDPWRGSQASDRIYAVEGDRSRNKDKTLQGGVYVGDGLPSDPVYNSVTNTIVYSKSGGNSKSGDGERDDNIGEAGIAEVVHEVKSGRLGWEELFSR